jgi:hypothetical protein
MKLRKFGSLVGLLSLTLVAPACGDDDDAETTDSADDADGDEDAGETSNDSDETESDDADETNTDTSTSEETESDTTEATTETSDEETRDAGEGDASGESTTTTEQGDASGTVESDADTTDNESDAGEDNPPPPPSCSENPTIEFAPAEITDDTTWDCDHIWVLAQGQLTVVANSTLTIEPGTKIIGESGGGLVIANSAKIDANGQVNAPIVFTSAKAEGDRAPMDWGGILLLGKAPINVEGGVAEAEGVPTTEGYAEFGGTDEAHDCGSMSYVQIQFSGFEVSPDNELNALGVAGCGTATELHHIHAHKGSDDGFEFWGGAPQVHHIVSSQNEDDLLDWTDGFTSSIQFVVLQNPADNGIEGDNSEANYSLTPRTLPKVSNMTLVGGNLVGILLRRGSFGKFYNSIIANNAVSAVDLRDDETVEGTEDGSLTIENSLFFANGESEQFFDDPALDGEFDEGAYFADEEYGNIFEVDPKLIDPVNATAPNFMPEDDTVLEGAVNPPEGMYDTQAKYLGAFEPGGDDWTEGWTAYPEN